MLRAHKRAFALVLKEETNDFENLDELDFVTRYRLSKRSVLHVLDRIEDQLEYSSNRNNGVSPINQLLCTLRFYATGCFSRNGRRPMWCQSCDNEEIKKTQMMFYQKAKFSRVIGAVDCTHIKFWQSPDMYPKLLIRQVGGEVPESYRNREGYFSLNVQVICNSKFRNHGHCSQISWMYSRRPNMEAMPMIKKDNRKRQTLVDVYFERMVRL
ncbi:unnamed protein product [Macrosiphum euphorbiae]|uniref:Transposase n=1 Tax=Macrosiphum euphorbiae TaxID=13131 RepID=A0AAV0XUS2_9HEMI|nr:unnamed protein product [Macrosiphum euphorbiae]